MAAMTMLMILFCKIVIANQMSDSLLNQIFDHRIQQNQIHVKTIVYFHVYIEDRNKSINLQ